MCITATELPLGQQFIFKDCALIEEVLILLPTALWDARTHLAPGGGTGNGGGGSSSTAPRCCSGSQRCSMRAVRPRWVRRDAALARSAYVTAALREPPLPASHSLCHCTPHSPLLPPPVIRIRRQPTPWRRELESGGRLCSLRLQCLSFYPILSCF